MQDAGGQTVGCFISANSEETRPPGQDAHPRLGVASAWNMVRAAAAQMGGHVSVSSRVGAGTTVRAGVATAGLETRLLIVTEVNGRIGRGRPFKEKKWNRHLEDVGCVLHAAGVDHSLRRHSMRSSRVKFMGCISQTDRRPSFALRVEDLSGAAVVGAAPLCDDCHLGAGCGALPVVLG